MNESFRAMRQMPRWRLFGIFVAITVVLALIASVLTYRFVLHETNAAPLKIALIAPVGGEHAAAGVGMEAGARQALVRALGVTASHPISLIVIDETAPDAAARAIADPGVVGMIGPYSATAAAQARSALEAAGLAAISLTPAAATGAAFYSIAPSSAQEVRFLANYVRNVLGERLVSIILPDDPGAAVLADEFDAVLRTFGTKVVCRWTISGGADVRRELDSTAAEFNEKQIAGMVLILGGPGFAAQAVAGLRTANVPNPVIGLREMATGAFTQALRGTWRGPGTVEAGLNGTVVATPILFDTAGSGAQEFRTALSGKTGETPDWIAVLSRDAASGLLQAIARLPTARTSDAAAVRRAMPKALGGYDRADRALPGLAGPLYFAGRAAVSPPRLAGVYDDTALVSSPIQLTPIREEGVSDYLEELREGRALYVNDRFM